jgi:hypothetical protein
MPRRSSPAPNQVFRCADPTWQLADKVSEFCRNTKSITFHDSLIVFERGRRVVPRHEQI